MQRRAFLGWAGALALMMGTQASGGELQGDAAWDALKRGGYTVLLRHGQTEPGVGDPPEFRLEVCRTQRNLSARGRADARLLGDGFRRRRVPVGEVWSSQWCRCLDTARLAFGRVSALPALNSIFQASSGDAERQIGEVRQLIRRPAATGNRILVTHERNIAALTGISPGSGGMVIVEPDEGDALRVVGRIEPSGY